MGVGILCNKCAFLPTFLSNCCVQAWPLISLSLTVGEVLIPYRILVHSNPVFTFNSLHSPFFSYLPQPTGEGTCTSCVLTVNGIVTANPGFDQDLVYDALFNLSEKDEPDLCYYPDEILDCADYRGLFPRKPESDCDPDPASGIFIIVSAGRLWALDFRFRSTRLTGAGL